MKASLIIASLLAALVPSSSLAMTLSAPAMIVDEMPMMMTTSVVESHSSDLTKESGGCKSTWACAVKFNVDETKYHSGKLSCHPAIEYSVFTYNYAQTTKSRVDVKVDTASGQYTLIMQPEPGVKRIEFSNFKLNVTLANGMQFMPVRCDKLVFTAK